jgi:hypothetical protein
MVTESKSFAGGAAAVSFSCRFDTVAADASDLGGTNAPQTLVKVAMAATISSTRQGFAILCIPPCTVAHRISPISCPPSVPTAIGSLKPIA